MRYLTGINLKVISQGVLMKFIHDMCSKTAIFYTTGRKYRSE